MSTDDNENGTKNAATGTRSRKKPDKEDHQEEAGSRPQTSGSLKRKRAAEKAAAPQKTAGKAAGGKAAKSKTGPTAKKTAAAGSSKSSAGKVRKTVGAGRTAKKSDGVPVEIPSVPDNVVQFPGAGGRTRPTQTGVRPKQKAQSGEAKLAMGTVPAGDAVLLALEGAELLADEVSTALGDLVDVALMTTVAAQESDHAGDDPGDALEALLIMLSEVHIKMGTIMLLTPPEEIVSQLISGDLDMSEYDVFVNKCMMALGRLSELIQDVHRTGRRAGAISGIRVLVEESVVDDLDEISETFEELASMLDEMVALLDSVPD